MSYNPQNPNGQASSANSSPVVIASDQSAVPVSGTVSITSNSAVNVAQVNGTATDTNTGTASAGTQRVVLATDQPQLTNAIKVDGSAVTQPVSGTITANVGTTNGLALDASVTSVQLTQGSTTSGQKGNLVMGAVTTAAPSYTNNQTSPLSLDTAGNLRVTSSGSSSVSINDGTTAANNLAGDTGQNSQITVGARKEASFTFAGAGNGTSYDVSNYRWVSVHVVANAGTVNFEGSNDNTNFVGIALINAQTTAGSAGTSTNSAGAIFHGPLVYRYFRLRQASSTSSGVIEFFANAAGMQTMGVTGGTVNATQSGTWTVQPGNTANTTSWNMNLSPTTTGGWSVSSQTSLTSTATVSGAAAKFGGYMFINLNAAPAYIQVFNLATSGAVTLGTTTPTFVVPIPANSTAANGAGANLELTNGISMSSGIQVAATTTPTGATTVTTGLTGFVLYK